MDRKEYDALVDLIAQMIETSEPKRAECSEDTAGGFGSTSSACWKKRFKITIVFTTPPVGTAATTTLTHTPEGIATDAVD